jgi:transposase
LADGLDASKEARRKLRVILETVAGECTVEEACEKLGIGAAAFYKLRERTLQDAAASLEPRKLGRPSKERKPEKDEIEALRAELFEVKKDLQAARLREEIAVVMPHLLRDKSGKRGGEKKGRRQKP